MNNSFDKFNNANIFNSTHQASHHSYLIHDTIQHTFDQRIQHHDIQSSADKDGIDSRTEDQMMSNLNFSIEDLLSKISKTTAEFQQHPKFNKPQSKPEYPALFKLSNLSASTETTSNQQRSDPYIEKYQPHVQATRKSEPNTEAYAGTEKNVRIGLGQKQNSLYQTNPQTRNSPRNQLRSQTYNEWKLSHKNQPQTTNQYIGGEYRTQNRGETINSEWGRTSTRNQTQPQSYTEWGRNSSRNQNFEQTKNQQFHQFKEYQPSQEWGRNSSRNQQKNQSIHNYQFSEPTQQWGRNSSRNQQTKIQSNNEWKNLENLNQWNHNSYNNTPKPDNSQELRSYQTQTHDWTKKFQKNETKTQPMEELSWKTIHKTQIDFQHPNNVYSFSNKKQFTSQPQISIRIQTSETWNNSATNSPKKELKSLLNPFHTSAFGTDNYVRNRAERKSIIVQDQYSAQQCQSVPVSADGKVNSLFDGRKIRQVAASTIIESPDKLKLKMKNPFNEILQTPNPIIQESAHEYLHDPLSFDVPTININIVQKSEVTSQQCLPNNLTIQDFHLGRQLGSGKFGDVYQAVHKATGVLYAIKKIFKSTIQEYNMIQQFTRELKIHYSLNYPNIIKLYTHFDDEYHVFLVMEYGEGGMLMEKINNGEKFSSVIVEQMLRAVEYLHNKKIAHRDIKPENIVLMFGDTAKLCDFGWSRFFDSDMKKTFCGTLDYVSPQMKDKGQYSLKIDIWSLGVLTFELLCGFAPFKDQITNWKKKGGNLNKAWNWNILYPPDLSNLAQSFMRNLLKENAEQRANIRFCLNHLFIRKYNQMSFNADQENRFKEVSMILKDE